MLLEHALMELLLTKDYTPQSRQRREYALRQFCAWAEAQGITTVEGITQSVVRRYLAHLRERPNQRSGQGRAFGLTLAGETQFSRASIVRMFLRFCVREEWLDARVVAYIEMPTRPKKVVEVLTREQYLRLTQAADACYVRWIRLRDKALVAVLFDTGIRAQEACTLTLDATFLAPGDSYIRIEGKGRKQREVGLGRQATLALHRYLAHGRPKAHQATTSAIRHEHVFLGREGTPLVPSSVDKVLYRLRDSAGPEHFQGIRVSAHTFRHSFAVHYLQQGGDLYKLSRLMGHENISTTERYLRAFQARDARKGGSVLDRLDQRERG